MLFFLSLAPAVDRLMRTLELGRRVVRRSEMDGADRFEERQSEARSIEGESSTWLGIQRGKNEGREGKERKKL